MKSALGIIAPYVANHSKKMLEAGLIVRMHDKVLGRDGFGEIAIAQYEMPIPVHYQWCSYWTEQPCEDGGEIG